MPKRKNKRYNRPKRPYDKVRIKEEDSVIKKYGLKNKREIWKAQAEIDKMRNQAKKLLTASTKEQEKFIDGLKKRGFKVASIADVLALDREDYLKRRLQTVIVEKNISTTPKQARQFITHKHITINNKVVNVPSYVVSVDEEEKISLKLVKKEKGDPVIKSMEGKNA